MNINDEAKRLRDRDAARADEARRLESAPTSGAPSLVARTKTIRTYPISAGMYYACESLTVVGPEVEGRPATITPDATSFFALNLGTAIPPQYTQILVTFVGNRWVFRYDG